MSNFTPLVTKKFSFDGDDVTIRFTRMKRKHFMKLLPFFVKFRDRLKTENGEDRLDIDEDTKLEIMEEAFDRLDDGLEKYVKYLEGLRDAAGNDVDIATMLEDSYFLELQLQLLMSLIDSSMGPSGKARRS